MIYTKDTIQYFKYTKYQIHCPKRQIHQDKQLADPCAFLSSSSSPSMLLLRQEFRRGRFLEDWPKGEDAPYPSWMASIESRELEGVHQIQRQCLLDKHVFFYDRYLFNCQNNVHCLVQLAINFDFFVFRMQIITIIRGSIDQILTNDHQHNDR